MTDVPKFVRQRMAEPAVGDHPEANLLAAFAEGGLSRREREQVLLHLGKCAVCRETLAVALPGNAVEQPRAAAAPPGMRWLRWPMLRWAGVGAAVVVVAAAVVIENSRHSAEIPSIRVTAPAAKSEPAKLPAESAAADEVARDSTERVPRKEAAVVRDLHAKVETRTDKKKDAAAGQFANSIAGPAPTPANKRADSNQPVQSQAATQSFDAAQAARVQQPAPTAPPAPAAGVLELEQQQKQQAAPASQAPRVNESAEVAAESGAVQMQQAKSQDRLPSALGGMNRARGTSEGKAGVAAQARPAGVSGGPLMKAAISVPPHWRLSTDGALERSTDSGQTWQLVRVAAPAPNLRAFSAVGGDIWAGGTGGALYRSADNGRTWARVTVKAGDLVLDSDIVRVEFTDAQHGALMTAAGETWTTDDAGVTWLVRR